MNAEADVIVVGAGLAGLAATAELVDAGKRVIVLDQESEASLGGKRFGPSAGCFSSIRRSNGGLGFGTPTRWHGRIGWGRRDLIVTKMHGRAAGRKPTSTSPRGKNMRG